MKSLIILFSLLIGFSGTTIGPERNDAWHTNYDKAIIKAKKNKKNVLVYFTGSDWCSPCKMLKKDLFETDAFKELSEDYILLYVDIPRNRDLLTPEQFDHNKKLLTKLNKKGVFPLFVALSPRGALLDEYSGYSMNGDVRYHIEFLNKNK